MKLSKIYCNLSDRFGPIEFQGGLSVIRAEIRDPQNKDKDTHNLGKSVLARLIDFCLLKRRHAEFFLFKHQDAFEDFVFYLEVQLADETYLTIRRSVAIASKISLKSHAEGKQTLTSDNEEDWDHFEVPFERSKNLVDGILDLTGLSPWGFRDALGYLLRSQNDYSDVFQLDKVRRSPHKHWKPFLSHVLGFDAVKVSDQYDVEDQIDEKRAEATVVRSQLGGTALDASKIDGLLLLKRNEAEKMANLLDTFDFREHDSEQTTDLVDRLNREIAELNSERYYLRENRARVVRSLNDSEMFFDPDDAASLFEEAGVAFQGQIKADFEQLISFNKSIGAERAKYLSDEQTAMDARLKSVEAELSSLGAERKVALAVLAQTDEVQKYKDLSTELVGLRADIESLERQKAATALLKELEAAIQELKDQRDELVSEVGKDLAIKSEEGQSRFSQIRLYFNDIIESVIGKQALIVVRQNGEGHLEFSAEILDPKGNPTSADDGHSYQKLLCMAFDMAVLRANIDRPYPRFVYHDGAFESLDDRKKINLLAQLRDYAEVGIQQIITVIDSDLPQSEGGHNDVFDSAEVVLHLHDQGESGRLFRMKSW